MCRRLATALTFVALLASGRGWAFHPTTTDPQGSTAQKAFFKPELSISLRNMPLHEARLRMPEARANAWSAFFRKYGNAFNVYIDPRSGTPTNIQGHIPLIPGDGVDNDVSLTSLSRELGRPVREVDSSVVGDVVRQFVVENADVLGLDVTQLGAPRVTQVTAHLWQVHFPQQINGVPVRHGRLAATISHGNLVLLGTESWGNVRLGTLPGISADQAIVAGLGYAGLQTTPKRFWKEATLEVIPFAPPHGQQGNSYVGALGQGYGHRLAWVYGFEDEPDHARWEVSVDAHTGEVLALEDRNQYADAFVSGGVYPLTNTGVCPTPQTCGTMQPNYPMPWTNTGMPPPNDHTSTGGIYNFTGGIATTTLNGKYLRVLDGCGAINNSSDSNGNIDMGGVNGDHDCTSGGGSAGNTPAARTSFYEVNRLAEMGRGWLPANTWLTAQLTANININSTCNAFWNGSTINFYKSGGGCRNTGEIAAVFDHEWGHGLDDFDANGVLSNSSEAYADIAAIYRLQASCIGYGFFWTSDRGCGKTSDNTGFNQNEAQVGAAHCNVDCSGVRDADWGKHADNTPDTPQNFVCPKCSSGSGPCGRQVHCAAAPVRQAAWDLVARDLRAAPFNYDSQTSFIIGNKLFFQGSGNVGSWHACDCTAGTSDGCGATNGYMQWLAADDDNGNLADGTPHMTAIHAAFNRHNIACATPAPTNGGCASGPTTAPTLSATGGGNHDKSLSWTSVSGATKYWVMRTEGHAGCELGKALIATVSGTTYTDTRVHTNRNHCYNVVAVGSSNACFSPASNCVCVSGVCSTPLDPPALVSPPDGATGLSTSPTLDWADVGGASHYEVQVATDAAFTNIVRSASSLTSSNWTVSPALPGGVTYHWRVRAQHFCGPSPYSQARSFTTEACPPSAPVAVSPPSGSTNVPVTPTLDWSDVMATPNYEVQVATDSAFTNIVRSATSVTTSSWAVSPALANNTTYYWRVRGVSSSCGGGSFSSTSSFTTAPATCTPMTAKYDPKYNAPTCNVPVCGCDSGMALNSRGTIAGTPEQNAPNTLGSACADGNAGTFHSDESIDRLRIETTDGTIMGPGKQVRATVTAWCYSTFDYLDLYYATDAGNPVWTPIATGIACAVSGPQVFTHIFNLGTAAGYQAIRAQLRYGGSASPCSTGIYDDHDDLVFTLGCAPTVASLNGTLGAPSCAIAACGCDTGTLVDSRGAIANKPEANAPNTIAASCADGNVGTYHADESIDRVTIRTADGSNMTPGKAVTVDVTVWCFSTSNRLDLYYSPTTTLPTWTPVAVDLACTASGPMTFSQPLTLANTTGQHAIRAHLRYGGTASPCTAGSYDDHDDMAFTVSSSATSQTTLEASSSPRTSALKQGRAGRSSR